jgi:HD-GYP domain-containing protein (c-di-GMP phosphodiesterase class II)
MHRLWGSRTPTTPHFGSPYRNRLAIERAIEIVRRQAGTQFDSKIVEVFLQLASNGQLG